MERLVTGVLFPIIAIGQLGLVALLHFAFHKCRCGLVHAGSHVLFVWICPSLRVRVLCSLRCLPLPRASCFVLIAFRH